MLINYISIKATIGRFIKEFGLESTAYTEDMPEWVEDAVEVIGIPNYYVTRYYLGKVNSYRCKLPCDILNLFGIYVTDTLSTTDKPETLKRLFLRNSPLFGNKGGYMTTEGASYGSISGGYLQTSFETGQVYMIYKGIPVDSEGFPLVPKDAKFAEALRYYFIYRMSLSGYKHPVIDFKTAYQMWEKLYPAAGNSINWMDLQEYQEFTEMWTNPILGDLNANNYIH